MVGRLALVVGCSDSVWDEVEAAQKLAKFDEFYVCKAAGIHWDQGYFHWCTLHPEYMENYKRLRREEGLPDCYEVIAPPIQEVGTHWQHPADRRVSFRWPGMSASGSSGMYAVKIALEDGCDRCVLAGVPMERGGNHFSRGQPWTQVDCFTLAWKEMESKLKDRVRSLSGMTQKMFGSPDPNWLRDGA